MYEYGVIFMHHNVRDVTLDHYKRVCALNPGVPIIPLSGGTEVIEGGIRLLDLDCYCRRWQHETDDGLPTKTWGSPDLGLCQWYSQNNIKCKRWMVMEWDTKCCMSWPDFWEPVWDAPSAGVKVFERDDLKQWYWFSKIDELLPARLSQYATGIYLFGCLMMSDQAFADVTKVLDEYYWGQSFSELRLGTLLNYTGHKPVKHPSPVGRIHHEAEALIGYPTDEKGIWHPMKNVPMTYVGKDGKVYTITHLLIKAKIEDGTEIPRPELTD